MATAELAIEAWHRGALPSKDDAPSWRPRAWFWTVGLRWPGGDQRCGWIIFVGFPRRVYAWLRWVRDDGLGAGVVRCPTFDSSDAAT